MYDDWNDKTDEPILDLIWELNQYEPRETALCDTDANEEMIRRKEAELEEKRKHPIRTFFGEASFAEVIVTLLHISIILGLWIFVFGYGLWSPRFPVIDKILMVFGAVSVVLPTAHIPDRMK